MCSGVACQMSEEERPKHRTTYTNYYAPALIKSTDQAASGSAAFASDAHYQYFTQQQSQEGGLDPSVRYEANRAARQMGHYFDPKTYPTAQNAPVQEAEKPKVTKKDIQRYKKRKEERKKIRNRWLYE